MDDRKPKTADWEPGTLDRTRKAIGEIDPEEAKFMSKILGGEVMYERSEDFEKKLPRKKSGRIIRYSSVSPSKIPELSDNNAENEKEYSKRGNDLPSISPKLSALFDKIMMSSEYQIKPNYGVFNFIKNFQKNGKEYIITEFCTITLKHHIEGIQGFINSIKALIQIAPPAYKAKITSGNEMKFKFLKMISEWSIKDIKLAYSDMLNSPLPYTVSELIPFTRNVFKLLMQIYYCGDNKIPKLIKEIYSDETAGLNVQNNNFSRLAKEAITSWLYIQNEVIKKQYPLIMRMCSATYEEYPDFFKIKISDVLKFTGLHKYELLLPEKPKKEEDDTEKDKKKEKETPVLGAKDGFVIAGINLLEQLFPQAGFKEIEKCPDMYPYFQPLYKFPDGFNLLNHKNPLQITIVLVRILEDCFHGCRNIRFNLKEDDKKEKYHDSITKIIDEWISYRETVFERLYCIPLIELVNQSYSQEGFESTLYGKKLLSSLLWQIKYHFLPYFKFEKLVLDRPPADESILPPLFRRTDFARKYLMEVSADCDRSESSRGKIDAVENVWEHYNFHIPNEISKRLDVLLGAQNTEADTNANNANLLKYTLCILSVLDWWLNNEESPAYSCPPMHIFRISLNDGKPLFSVPVREDQNKLFADSIRAAYEKKNQAAAAASAPKENAADIETE